MLLVSIVGWLIVRNLGGPAELKKVTVSQAFEHLLYIGLYVANDAGFFSEEGLEVSIQTAGGDAQAFAALSSGSADFAQGDPAFVAIGHEQGWDGKVVVMAVDRVAIWGVTFDSTITPFSDPVGFRGRTVTTYPEPNTSYVVQKQLAQRAGLEIDKDVTILQVPFGSELATLKNGQADIAQTIEPNATQVEQEGGIIVFSYPEAWGPLAFTGVMVSQKMIDSDPETVQRFVNAYEKALKYIREDFEGTVRIARNHLPDLSDQTIRIALRRLVDSGCIPEHTKVNPTSWEKLLQIRVEVGDLKQMPVAPLYDNTFSTRAQGSSN